MTSFCFYCCLIPLVRATGPGAIGNRTIVTTAVGGMLIGTVVGVLVIPGLYYLFAKMLTGKQLIKDEHDEPLSELFERDDHREIRTQGNRASNLNADHCFCRLLLSLLRLCHAAIFLS